MDYLISNLVGNPVSNLVSNPVGNLVIGNVIVG